MLPQRASGILLHPTSLPSPFGIGDLGTEAYRFIDFLAESAQQYWQVLPLGPTGYGNSPYLSYSALAGNPLLISPEKLREEGWLEASDWANFPEFPAKRVDYDLVVETKMPLLRQAFDRFNQAPPTKHADYEDFCSHHAHWLDDYALFMALKEAYGGQSWNQWDKTLAKREPQVLNEWRDRLQTQIRFFKYLQYEFFRQWQHLKQYANDRGIKIFGDIPIYVAHDSVEVWAHQDIFCLDEETGEPSLMAGVPPDYFSATGQLWGNPVYNWEQVERNNFEWWLQRFEGILEKVDLIRIDHFRGFEAFWAVKQGQQDAREGEWIKAPGDRFFQLLGEKLGQLPIVAEDLGLITPEVEALRDRFGFPGMKVLQFAFGDSPDNPYLPFNYHNRNCIVYTGTHDNDTTVGWFENLPSPDQKQVIEYLGCVCPEGIHWSLIRLALSSVANLAIIPLQDLLGLGSEAKMNTPGQQEGNWEWRYTCEQLTSEIQDRLLRLTQMYGRVPHR